jgi:hypothetical protein
MSQAGRTARARERHGAACGDDGARAFLVLVGEAEEAAMPAGLHRQKRGVEADPNQREKHLLGVRQVRTWRGLSEIRQDQRQHHQCDDDSEIGVGALKIVLLLAMTPAAEEQRQADHAVEDNHHHGEQSVPGQARIVRAMQHDGGDACDLDEGD